MGKRIRKSDDFYQESLIWMGYRYAIGISNCGSGRCRELVESLKAFQSIEYDTPEFHALAGAFMDFLKRKKITDIVQLRDRYRENDLIWLSRNYAMGRHSYAASHCEDIISYSDELASYFLPSCHKKCRMVYDGKESIVPYIDSWTRIGDRSGKMQYERVKVPIDKRLGFFRRSFLVEEYIVEDNI